MSSTNPKFIVIGFRSALFVVGKFVDLPAPVIEINAEILTEAERSAEAAGFTDDEKKILNRTFNSPFLDNLFFAGAYDEDRDLEHIGDNVDELPEHIWIRRRSLVWTLSRDNFFRLDGSSPTNEWINYHASCSPFLRRLSFAGAFKDASDDPFVAGGGHGP